MSSRFFYPLRLVCGTLLLCFFALTPREAEADTDVTVDDTRDSPDPSPNIGGCSSFVGTCTLRAAIQRANHRLTGTHTIRLPAGHFSVSRFGAGEDDAETGDLDIKGNIVIIGAGAKSTFIDGERADRVFDVHSGSLILQDLTVSRGVAENANGGGIRAKAPLTLNRVHLHSNEAPQGSGGGIYTDSDLSVVRSTISNNTSLDAGIAGARHNTILKAGISIRESTISGNIGFDGGIAFAGRFDIEISHSTIAFNNSAILFIDIGVNGSLTISDTILASNNLGTNCFLNLAVTAAFNIDSDGSCGFSANNNNLILVDPKLGPLQDNGGQTPTHAFLTRTPPAIDAGGAACSGVDQRGLPRPVDIPDLGSPGPKCDIGAIELQGTTGIPVLEPANATVKKGKPFDLSYLWRVPPDENWHDLKTLDLRVVERDKDDKGRNHRHDDEVIFWVRWSEATNTFQLIDPKNGHASGPAFPAGSNHVLETEDVALDVKHSSSVGSGPTGQEVTLHLALTFHEKTKKDEVFTIEVTAVDDSGQTQPFLALGSVAVDPPKAH